jgi:bacillithiol system protein YtxJ
MNWIALENIAQLDTIIELSKTVPCLLFKHSTRCSISSMALNRLENSWKNEDNKHLTPYYLDLLQHRAISNEIAQRFGVEHQSPQALIISNGKCIYYASHSDIRYNEIIHFAK